MIGERYRFFQRDQRPSESVSAYVAELRHLARACEFKDHLPEALRDRFVCGLRSAGTRRKLLAIADLTFDKAVTDAQADELATRDAVEVSADSSRSGASGGSSSVHQVYSTSKTRLPSGRQAETSPCYRCGGQHSPKECRFRDAECRFCHKIGHLQRVCRSKNAPADSKKAGAKPVPKPRGRKSTSTHHVMTDYSRHDSADEMIKYVRVAHVAGKPPAPIFADAKVHGQTLRFEVDTGAGVSILPAALYTRKFADQPLQPCRLRLTTYNGEPLHSQGVMCVPVEINGQRADAELYVVDCEGPPLLGRPWLEQFRLDWTAVHTITTVPASQAVQDLKARYQAVFGSDQGRMKGVQARLTLKPDAVPRFMKARSVPLALRPKVEEELHRMEKAGIVTKVDWSSWATPVDNRPQFTSTDFGSFLEANGIRHRRTAPYHPATNGLAERFVQSFKRAVAAGSSSDPVQAVADRFLLCYRNTPHPTTGEPPAVLLLGRMLRTRLDLLRPDRQGKVAASQAAQAKASNRQPARWFTQGMAVLVRDYRTRQPSWIPATITSIHGPRSYDVETSAGATWTRHLDQIRAIDSSAASNMEGGRVPTRHTMPMYPSPVRDEDELPTPATTTPTQPAAPPVVSSSAPPIASSSAPPIASSSASTTTLEVADQPPEPLRRSNRARKAVDRLNL